MPAVSDNAQQRFMGMVYAAKKGKNKISFSRGCSSASSMKQKDAKDFASTKHKGLPEKKVAKEAKDFSQRDKIMKKQNHFINIYTIDFTKRILLVM